MQTRPLDPSGPRRSGAGLLARLVLAGAASLTLGSLAWAHYPMTLTDEGMTRAGEPVDFVITNGHPFMNDRVDVLKPERVRVYPPQRRARSLIARIKSTTTPQGTKAYTLRYTPQSEGDYIFSFHTGAVFEKPQRRVADYVKLILHVKHRSGAQVGWRRVIGDPVEIVPYTRPYAVPVGTAFRGRAVFNTRKGPRKRQVVSTAMIEAVVEAECFTPDRRPGWDYLPNNRLAVQTDENGYFVVSLTQPGWWMLSVATDGGPGEQGTSEHLARRAVLWLQVGGTSFDRAKTLSLRRKGAPPPRALSPEAKVQWLGKDGRPTKSIHLSNRKDLTALQTNLQLLELAPPRTPLERPTPGAIVIHTDFLWDIQRVVVGREFLTLYDSDGKGVVYEDTHDLYTWVSRLK